MNYEQLLLEYNKERILNDFSKKMAEKYTAEHPLVHPDPKYILPHLEKYDPTANNEYVFWLAGTYARNGIERFEDIPSKASPALAKYHQLKLKKKIPNELRDINRIKSLSELMDIVDQYYKEEDHPTESLEQKFYTSKEATLIYNDSEIKIVIPKTVEASRYFGVNTRWCTAAKSGNMFTYYNKQGPLFIVLIKKENKRFQFHFQTDQFMDEKFSSINANELADHYPKLWDIFTPIAEKFNSIILNKSPSEETYTVGLKKDGRLIQYIDNPSEYLQIAAVTSPFKDVIKYIKNPSEEVQLKAVTRNGDALQFINNPSDNVKLVALKNSLSMFRYIKNPTREMELIAVRGHGAAIQFINNPDEELKKLAVSNSYDAIKFIDNPSEEVQLLSVQRNGGSIYHIKNPSDKIKMAAVQQRGPAIQYIKNPTEEMKIRAVLTTGWAIQHIEDPSEDVQQLAVSKNPSSIEYIKNPTHKVQMMAVHRNGLLLRFCKKPSADVIKRALDNNLEAARYLRKLDDETVLRVIKEVPIAIKKTKNRDKDFVRKCLELSPMVIRFLDNPPEEYTSLAVTKMPMVIRYIKDPSPETQKIAVTLRPLALTYIKEPTDEAAIIAINKNVSYFYSIKKLSTNMCKALLRKDPDYLNHLPPEFKEELYQYAEELKKNKSKKKSVEESSSVQRSTYNMGIVTKPFDQGYWNKDGRSAEKFNPFPIGSLVQSLATKRNYSVIGYDSHGRVIVADPSTTDRKKRFDPTKLRLNS